MACFFFISTFTCGFKIMKKKIDRASWLWMPVAEVIRSAWEKVVHVVDRITYMSSVDPLKWRRRGVWSSFSDVFCWFPCFCIYPYGALCRNFMKCNSWREKFFASSSSFVFSGQPNKLRPRSHRNALHYCSVISYANAEHIPPKHATSLEKR